MGVNRNPYQGAPVAASTPSGSDAVSPGGFHDKVAFSDHPPSETGLSLSVNLDGVAATTPVPTMQEEVAEIEEIEDWTPMRSSVETLQGKLLIASISRPHGKIPELLKNLTEMMDRFNKHYFYHLRDPELPRKALVKSNSPAAREGRAIVGAVLTILPVVSRTIDEALAAGSESRLNRILRGLKNTGQMAAMVLLNLTVVPIAAVLGLPLGIPVAVFDALADNAHAKEFKESWTRKSTLERAMVVVFFPVYFGIRGAKRLGGVVCGWVDSIEQTRQARHWPERREAVRAAIERVKDEALKLDLEV